MTKSSFPLPQDWRDAVLVGHQAIEVALDHDGPVALADARLGEFQRVEELPLGIERGLR